MEIGCNTYSLKALERTPALAEIRRIGFAAVELWAGHANYLEGTLDPRAIRRELDDLGLALRAYCIGGLFGLSIDAVADRVTRAFAFAGGLGVDLVTGIVDRHAVPVIDRLCGAHGMRFAIENHWYTEFARPEDYERPLHDASPAVGVNVDTGHFAFLGCDLGDVAARLGPRTLNVHLKAVQAPGRFELAWRRFRKYRKLDAALPGPSDGFAELAAGLRRVEYAGMLAVEHEADGIRSVDLGRYRARAMELVTDAPHEGAVVRAREYASA
jgi:sugar phosphate isomerase/epimerase